MVRPVDLTVEGERPYSSRTDPEAFAEEGVGKRRPLESVGTGREKVFEKEYDTVTAKGIDDDCYSIVHEGYARRMDDENREELLYDMEEAVNGAAEYLDDVDEREPVLPDGGDFYSVTINEALRYSGRSDIVGRDDVLDDDATDVVMGVHMVVYDHEDLDEDYVVHYDPAVIGDTMSEGSKAKLEVDDGVYTLDEGIERVASVFESQVEQCSRFADALAGHSSFEYDEGVRDVRAVEETTQDAVSAGKDPSELREYAGQVKERYTEQVRDDWMRLRMAAMAETVRSFGELRSEERGL